MKCDDVVAFIHPSSICREWTGDLKKLPNIKLRKVSKVSEAKDEGKEEKHEAEDKNEDDSDDGELDDIMLDIVWSWLNWLYKWTSDWPSAKTWLKHAATPCLPGRWPPHHHPTGPWESSWCSVTSHQPVRGSTFIVYCTNKYASYGTWILKIFFIQSGIEKKKG